MKKKLTATTEHGVFTRTTARDYLFVNVFKCHYKALPEVSWHGTYEAALKSSSSKYNRNRFLGRYPVDK